MVNRELILDRMSRVREYVKNLKELAKLPMEEFVSDFKSTNSAERLLQISIEACLDIGNHIISRCGLERPREYIRMSSLYLAERGFFRILLQKSLSLWSNSETGSYIFIGK